MKTKLFTWVLKLFFIAVVIFLLLEAAHQKEVMKDSQESIYQLQQGLQECYDETFYYPIGQNMSGATLADNLIKQNISFEVPTNPLTGKKLILGEEDNIIYSSRENGDRFLLQAFYKDKLIYELDQGADGQAKL
ncbi:MAG: hypothetical protein HQL32_13445 [Planctomycetes bacterium]|nr:hypothetical protein [Planctomycetota bacterium]